MTPEAFLELLKAYGPAVGVLLVLVWFLTTALNKILEDLKSSYRNEREYLRSQNDTLLRHLMGRPELPSEDDPDVPTLPRKKGQRQGDLFRDDG